MKIMKLSLLLICFLQLSCSEERQTNDNSDNSDLSINQIDFKPEFPEIEYSSLLDLNADELRLTRNSFYAKYGMIFKSDDLNSFFKEKEWYIPNDNFSMDLISEEDKKIIMLISFLEGNEGVIWKEGVDLDGDGEREICMFVESKDHKSGNLMINGNSFFIPNHWMKDGDFFAAEYDEPCLGIVPGECWVALTIEVVDIKKDDNRKEILFRQSFCDVEDPGMDNLLLTKFNGELRTFDLGSGDYNGGKIEMLEDDKFIVRMSYCPFHTETYTIADGDLVLIEKIEEEYPEEGCPACFISNSKVSISRKETKEIKDLKVGDLVLTYDFIAKKQYQTRVNELVSVKHNNLVELYFDHDTIVSTMDHPYYVIGKGWGSFNPMKTVSNYSNYDEVNIIENGDMFLFEEGKEKKLLGYSLVEEEKLTYTISELEKGNTFYINGILVGVEELHKLVHEKKEI